MKRAGIIFCVIALFIIACTQHGAVNKSKTDTPTLSAKKITDTLAFTYENDGGKTDTCKNPKGCNYIDVNYPHFTKPIVLNDTLEKMILESLSDYANDDVKKSGNFKEKLKNIADAFAEPDTTVDDETPTPTTVDLNIKVNLQGKDLVVLDVDYEYSGGAHPNTEISYINWNTKTNKQISLYDILVANYGAALTKVAEKIFRKDKQLSERAPLDDYNFENGIFALNNNFQITPASLDFYYNSYEIASYAQGPTELLIPYNKIKSLLRPNTVVSQYIK